ncbi:MAG: hypothetical protein NC191_04545 [Muribaculaceae bacterium]|nr:hypothetical protein [Muribaculaceae bacterium]
MTTETAKTFTGVNGQITMSFSKVDITRKGLKAFMCHGFDGTKTIFLRKLTALQFKEAGNATNGYIQFIFPGSMEDKSGLWGASKDENTVLFNKEQQPQFEELRDIIITKIDF